jgi:hypothetical protein
MTKPDAVSAILEDKSIKAKEKTDRLSRLLLNKKLTIEQLIETAKLQPDAQKAILIEAMELASKTNPAIVTDKGFQFVINSLKDEAPRVKLESARVIANTVHLFPKLLNKAVVNLLTNTEHEGTVVRWGAAGALAKIIECNSALNKELIPAAEAILEREEDNAIKKIYQKTFKKIGSSNRGK